MQAKDLDSKLLREFAKAKPWYWKATKPDESWKPLKTIAHNMSDPDKDGYPNAIDCSNFNRHKQGVEIETNGKKINLGSVIKEKIEAYKANAPARKEAAEKRTEENRKKALEAAAYRTQMLEQQQRQESIKGQIASSQTQRQMQQIKIMEARQKTMQAMPNPFSSGMGGYGKPMAVPKMSDVWNINPMNPMASLKQEKPKVKVIYRTKKHHRRKK